MLIIHLPGLWEKVKQTRKLKTRQVSFLGPLAYSTIAKMGFMMLQCGLGAFSAALLHIVAHSAYKSHAFLSCGSVLDNVALMKVPAMPASEVSRSALVFTGAIALGAGIVFGTFQAIGIDIITKPGGAVLGLILTLALVQLLWSGLSTGVIGLALRSIANALLVAVTYSVAYLAMDHLVASSASHHTVVPSMLNVAVLGLVALGFVGVFALQNLSGSLVQHRWVKALYIHAMNGFYLDIPARRLTAWFYRQAAPVQ